MILGIGTDICENYRIKKIFDEFKDKFLEKIYMNEEIEYCMKMKNPIPHLSARFALKEAFIKALSLRVSHGISYKEVGIIGNTGKKELKILGTLLQLYEKTGADNAQFSISHSKDNSIAFVILEKKALSI
ncbi:MAG: holo-ACP synthase [Spirochaetia bacterium]|nr:holo-ACP synthase [Spirochaetia bacterium]